MTKPPLYRKVNTTAHRVPHRSGGDYSADRNRKRFRNSDSARKGMSKNVRRGLDYTPLFKFLLSKVGAPWTEVHTEAASRLDRPDPIFWLVALRPEDEQECVRVGEASYYSGLRVDADGILRVVNPSLGPTSLVPQCTCCTHTFNGVRLTQRSKPADDP